MNKNKFVSKCLECGKAIEVTKRIEKGKVEQKKEELEFLLKVPQEIRDYSFIRRRIKQLQKEINSQGIIKNEIQGSKRSIGDLKSLNRGECPLNDFKEPDTKEIGDNSQQRQKQNPLDFQSSESVDVDGESFTGTENIRDKVGYFADSSPKEIGGFMK